MRLVKCSSWTENGVGRLGTISGPKMKAEAVPSVLAMLIMAVAVVRCSTGNHSADTTGPMTCVES